MFGSANHVAGWGELLRREQSVRVENRDLTATVTGFLGAGGQGEVYAARLGGRDVALKWYFPSWATPEQRRVLKTLVRKGSPGDQFLWPLGLADIAHGPGFGYVMPLRPTRFRAVTEIVEGRVDPSLGALAVTGRNLAQAFLRLHADGLCYRDISFGNVFFDPDSGDVLVCDNDNVGVDGERQSDLLGTLRFMAPEVVRGEVYPSGMTDLFSLAVLLFFLFVVHHPFEGERELAVTCLDLAGMVELYGIDPVFVFDPTDESNRPVPGFHDNALAFWPTLPQFLRDLFTRSFTVGVSDPANGRVRESEWRAAMARLHDGVCYCQECGSESYCAACDPGVGPSMTQRCWSCSAELQVPPRLRLEHTTLCLNRDTFLHAHHIERNALYDFTRRVAVVARHPQKPDVWGLRNLTRVPWRVTTPRGVRRDVGEGQSVTLARGVRIDFGTRQGEIA